MTDQGTLPLLDSPTLPNTPALPVRVTGHQAVGDLGLAFKRGGATFLNWFGKPRAARLTKRSMKRRADIAIERRRTEGAFLPSRTGLKTLSDGRFYGWAFWKRVAGYQMRRWIEAKMPT